MEKQKQGNMVKELQNKLPSMRGSVFVILHQGKVWNNLYFDNLKQARNHIKMSYPTKRWKEQIENTLVCSQWGTTFKIEELI